MTVMEILANFQLKGIMQIDIARKFNVTHVMIYQVIRGRSKSRRIQAEIAQILGKEIDEIWPSNVVQ